MATVPIKKMVTRSIANMDGGVKKFSTDVMPNEVLEGVEIANSSAESAQNTASTAKNTAETAQSIAESAQNTANNLKITMSGSPTMEKLFLRSRQSGNQDRTSLDLATKDNYTSMELVESIAGGHTLVISRDGGLHDAATVYNPATLKLVNLGGTKGVIIEGLDALIINSSTSGSTKKFKIKVDDAGTISATEVTT